MDQGKLSRIVGTVDGLGQKIMMAMSHSPCSNNCTICSGCHVLIYDKHRFAEELAVLIASVMKEK